jgi:NAD(P)-dependent dehydrogenase (short-subunit alcohol dehydrogenase family)
MGPRDLHKGQEATKSLSGLLGSVQACQLDITSRDSIGACVAYVKDQFGSFDMLINNAGIGSDNIPGKPLLRKKFQKISEANVFGGACLTEAFIPLLKKANVPRVVFITSELDSNGNPLDPKFPYYGLDTVPYKTSKAVLNMIGATYHVKYASEGFKFNLCCLGLRKTGITGHMEGTGDPSEGAINACILATLGKDGESGENGPFPW